MLKKILNIRLTYIYPAFFIIFFFILTNFTPQKLTAGQLALYSVNTFLFGFYFSPLLSAQKGRVDELNKTARKETMILLDILTQSHLLPSSDRHQLKVRMLTYMESIIDQPDVRADNEYYDELLHFTKQDKYKDNSVMNVIYERVAKTQENRDTIQSLRSNNVYSHEWLVTLVLFSITLFFIMQTDYNGVLFFRVLLAVLLTGLSLMLVILAKYATLTHKQAKKMWTPLKDLRKEHFEDVTMSEVKQIRADIAAEKAERHKATLKI